MQPIFSLSRLRGRCKLFPYTIFVIVQKQMLLSAEHVCTTVAIVDREQPSCLLQLLKLPAVRRNDQRNVEPFLPPASQCYIYIYTLVVCEYIFVDRGTYFLFVRSPDKANVTTATIL